MEWSNDIVTELFIQADLDTVWRLRQLSKRWHTISQTPLIWTQKIETEFPDGQYTVGLNGLLNYRYLKTKMATLNRAWTLIESKRGVVTEQPTSTSIVAFAMMSMLKPKIDYTADELTLLRAITVDVVKIMNFVLQSGSFSSTLNRFGSFASNYYDILKTTMSSPLDDSTLITIEKAISSCGRSLYLKAVSILGDLIVDYDSQADRIRTFGVVEFETAFGPLRAPLDELMSEIDQRNKLEAEKLMMLLIGIKS